MKLSKALLAVGLVGMLFGVMATAVVAANGTGGAVPAAPAPSAKQLLDEAKKLYAAHNYEGALKRLLAVNRDQLSFWDKGSYDSLLEKAKKAGPAKAADAKALDDGKAALEAKKFATAVAKLSQAASSDYLEAGDAQKAKSLRLLAEDRERKAAEQASGLVSKAKADLKAGKTAEARKDVDAVKAMDVKLGWMDSRTLADVESKLASAEKAPPAAKPVEKTPVAIKATVVEAKAPVALAAAAPEAKTPVAEKPAEKAPAKPAAPSAKQRVDEAGKLYDAKNYDAAMKQLNAANRSQLNLFEKWGYDSLRSKIAKAVAGKAADEKALADGQAALEAKKYSTAVAALSQAAGSDYLAKDQQAEAKALQAKAQDAKAKADERAKVLLEAGKQAYKDGRVADARKNVQELKGLDVKLGMWDSRVLSDLERKLAKAEAAPAKAPMAVAAKPVAKAPVVVVEKPVEKAPVVVVEKPAEKAPVVVAAKPAAKPAMKVRAKAPAAAAGGRSVLQQAKRAEAEDELKLGAEAMAQHEIDKAKIHYRKALDLWPDSEKAKAGLQEAMQYTGEREAPVLGMLTTANQVERQRVIADVQELLSQAEAAMGRAERPEDLNEALRPLAAADRVVDLARVLSAEEAERLREEVYVLRKQIMERKKVMEDLRTVQATSEAERREAARRLADKIERQNKIKQLWERATELRKSMQFAEAIQMLDRLIAISPTDERAQRWREDLLYLEAQKRQVEIRTARESGAVDAFADTEESASRPGEWVNGELTYLRYPTAKSWKELTEFRRAFTQAVTAEPKAVAETRRRLAEEIDLDFERTNLDNVLKYIAEVQRGLNIVIDPDIGAGGIDLSTRVVDLKVKRVSIEAVLNLILGADLGYKVESGYILVTTKEKMQQNLPMVTYPVQDLIATIPDFGGQAPRFEIENLGQGKTGGGGGGGSLFGAGAAPAEEVAPIGSQELIDIIKRTVSATANPQVAAWSDEGGPAAIDFLNGLLIVTQTRKGHERLGDLLEQLRRERAIMISVEARFVQVSDEFLQDITLDVDIDINNPGAHWELTPPVGERDISISSAAGAISLMTAPKVGTAFASFTGTMGGLSIAGNFLDDIQVGFLLRAIQADVRSTVLQAPRITLYNGQRSYITVSTVRTYVSDLTAIAGAGGGIGGVAEAAYQPIIGAVPIGMTLDVRATVSADRRYVQMDLRPQVSDIVEMRTYGWGGGDAITAPAKIDMPEVSVQDFKTTVSVPDGGTLLLGGTKKLNETETETGVPLLSKIPILKRLFNNRGTLRTNKNLLIMIRPKILLQAEEEHKLGYDNF